MTTTSTEQPPRPSAAPTDDSGAPGTATEHHRVIVIGTGFGGIGTAIALRRHGFSDVVLLEKADDVGGTWRDNTYPNCQCDVPSNLYSFSHTPNPEWSRTFAPQGEIQNYLRGVVDAEKLRPLIRFGHEVTEARWNADVSRWDITTPAGRFSAEVLVSAHGGLSAPAVPDIEGLDQFEGTVFHSANWNHDHDLAGERVAVIGTGASAIQIVPGIVDTVGHLDVYQRTPAWIVPRLDREVSERQKTWYRRLPTLQLANRAVQYASRELMAIALTRRPALLRFPERAARDHLERQVPDPALRAELTPTYQIGCKRILLSNDFYPALQKPNAELITGGVSRITATGVVDTHGTERPVDTIVLATGFNVTQHPIAGKVFVADGVSLAERWNNGMRAYLGTTLDGFPNFFALMGPNTGLGHSSIVYMLESQINYVLDCLLHMDAERIATYEVRPDAVATFDAEMQKRLASSVWNQGGCASWYLDSTGRNTVMWPGFTFEFRRRLKHFDPSAYTAVSRPGVPGRFGPEAPNAAVASAGAVAT
jgi:cation diffusion facilitator CzcD-associated flavoprotein CzcO